MERRLHWHGHVMRRDEERILRKVVRMDKNQEKGRPKTRWKEEHVPMRQSRRGDGHGDMELEDRLSHNGDPTM